MGSGKIDTSLLNVVGVGGVGVGGNGVGVGGKGVGVGVTGVGVGVTGVGVGVTGVGVGVTGVGVGASGVGVGGVILITFRESIAPAVPLILAFPITKGVGGLVLPPPWLMVTEPC